MSLIKNGENTSGFHDSEEKGHFLSQELTAFLGQKAVTKPEVKKATYANCLGPLA